MSTLEAGMFFIVNFLKVNLGVGMVLELTGDLDIDGFVGRKYCGLPKRGRPKPAYHVFAGFDFGPLDFERPNVTFVASHVSFRGDKSFVHCSSPYTLSIAVIT
jgi:hypothetical protein